MWRTFPAAGPGAVLNKRTNVLMKIWNTFYQELTNKVMYISHSKTLKSLKLFFRCALLVSEEDGLMEPPSEVHLSGIGFSVDDTTGMLHLGHPIEEPPVVRVSKCIIPKTLSNVLKLVVLRKQ